MDGQRTGGGDPRLSWLVLFAAMASSLLVCGAVAFLFGRPGEPPESTRPLRMALWGVALVALFAAQRLIANLVENALRHGNGRVEVTTAVQNGSAVLEVLDRGPGIPPGVAERMLQPFTRLDTARSGSGTGLGLAIVDRIARLHGGSVQLLPRDGGGLRVRVELPLKT